MWFPRDFSDVRSYPPQPLRRSWSILGLEELKEPTWTHGLEPRFAWKVGLLLHVAESAGFPLRVSSAFRSPAKQAELYSAWTAGKSRLPAAKPGRSLHEKGRAVDVVWASTGLAEPRPGLWQALGAFAENYLGLRWGGRWATPDPVHFEER